MKRISFSNVVATALLAATASGAASVAQARPETRVGVELPVAVWAQPVFDRRDPVDPSPRMGHEPAWRSPYRADFERERAWRRAEWERRQWQRREWERREWQRRGWERHDHGFDPSHGRD